jgi:tetratricopeptide (TPR) repeat protein
MDLSGLFLLATIVMAIVAVGFVALPLLRNNKKAAMIAVAIAVPMLASTLYMSLGSPDSAHSVLSQPSITSSHRSGNTSGEKFGSVASMLDGLASRLEKDPDDGGNWLLLARSYKYLDRMNEAIDAYEHAVALGQFDAELDALSNMDTTSSPAGAQISGNVKLAPEALDIVLPTDTVFIFAKAVNGPPAPIAVLQRAASELPIDFQLNDSQSMVTGMNLSTFDEVVVTARITREGDATVALQDLEAKSDTIRTADSPHLNLTIQ